MTTAGQSAGQRGFSVLEISIGAGLMSFLVGTLVSAFGATSGQVKNVRIDVRATQEHRLNLDALSNLLRDVDVNTLQNFDNEWKSTNPQFSRVTGASLTDRTHSDTLELRWVASQTAVEGVPLPGAVYLITPTGNRLVAKQVPQNGFELRQDGGTLVISLATYFVTSDGSSAVVRGETAVSLRN